MSPSSKGYDLNPLVTSKFINISTRGYVQTNNQVMIGGLILQGGNPVRMVVRAIGPSLGQYGVPNPLLNPTLTLDHLNGAQFHSTIIGEAISKLTFKLPASPRRMMRKARFLSHSHPAVIRPLVRGASDGVGVALVEAYQLAH